MVWRRWRRPRTEARTRRQDNHSRGLTPDGPLRKPGFLTGSRCIGALNERKFFCNKALGRRGGAPRCRQSVARSCLSLHAVEDRAGGGRRSMVGRSPRTPGRCFWAPPIGRSAWSAVRRLLRRSARRRTGSSTSDHVGRPARVRLALGYEDLVDHDTLRHDPVLAVWPATRPPAAPTARRWPASRRSTGSSMRRPGSPRAIIRSAMTAAAIERLFVELFLDAHRTRRPRRSCSTWMRPTTRCTAHQEGPVLPRLLWLLLLPAALRLLRSITCWRRSCGGRTSTPAPARCEEDAQTARARQIRGPRWPRRAHRPARRFAASPGSGLMAWCEANRVDYVLGLARNPRLVVRSRPSSTRPRATPNETGRAARCFKDFRYQTLDSWSRRAARGRPFAGSRPRPLRGSDRAEPDGRAAGRRQRRPRAWPEPPEIPCCGSSG